LATIKAVREVKAGLGLAEAKRWWKARPRRYWKALRKPRPDEAKKKLEAAAPSGGQVTGGTLGAVVPRVGDRHPVSQGGAK